MPAIYRADHIGSFLRPPELLEARRAVATKPERLRAIEDRRIEEAARYVPLESLALSPQCGFASTMEGNLLTEEQQWAKLRLVVDIARQAWN